MVRADVRAFLVDVKVDQHPDRPFVYAAEQSGWAVIDVSDPAVPEVAVIVPADYEPERGAGISSIDYLALDDRVLVAVGRADRLELYDVTDVSENERPNLVSTIEGKFRTIFAYRHSSGASLIIASSGGNAGIFDAQSLLEGDASALAEIATPELPDSTFGFDSIVAAYHAGTDADRFYGAGAGGYHVFDIADLASVEYVTSANPAAIRRGLSVSPSADGRYLIATGRYRTAPVRIFDLQPTVEGRFSVVRTSVGAWANNWRGFHLDHETRWPYVFVAASEQGLQIFNARDVTEPYTMGSFATSRRGEGTVNDLPEEAGGAVAVDIRNHDGFVVVGDQETGVWLVRMDAFRSWDGRGWGYPNISSAQDWINGPDGSSTFD